MWPPVGVRLLGASAQVSIFASEFPLLTSHVSDRFARCCGRVLTRDFDVADQFPVLLDESLVGRAFAAFAFVEQCYDALFGSPEGWLRDVRTSDNTAYGRGDLSPFDIAACGPSHWHRPSMRSRGAPRLRLASRLTSESKRGFSLECGARATFSNRSHQTHHLSDSLTEYAGS